MKSSMHVSRLLGASVAPVGAVALGAWLAACGTTSGDNGQNVFPPGEDGGSSVFDLDGSLLVNDPDAAGRARADVTALGFEPPTQTLTLDGITGGTASYRLKATLVDGTTTYVTPESLQFDRPDLATAANGSPVVLTADGTFAGVGKLHAVYAGHEATAELIVAVHQRALPGGVDPGVAAALDDATAADSAVTTMLYPYDKTVFPLGLTSPLVMWNAPAPAQTYRLRIEETNYVYDAYAPIPTLGQFRVDQAMWDRLTASNGGGADPIKVTLSRHDGTHAYVSAKASWTIAPASLRGAIYYWTASMLADGTRSGHLARIRPGSGAQPERMRTGQSDEAQCMGCHAVSADGSTLAAAVDIAPTGDPASYPYTNGWMQGRAWASFDLPSGAVRKQTRFYGGNLALTGDGKYAVFGGQAKTNSGPVQSGSKYLSLADTATGTIVKDSGLDAVALTSGMGMQMPAFSPDSKWLAAVEAGGNLRDNVINDGNQLIVLGFDEAAKKFNATPTRLPLGPSGAFSPFDKTGLGYPSFTPDAKYVAFHVGNHSTGCFDGCDDNVHHKGNLFLQAANGTSGPVRLTALNAPPASSDQNLSVEPTFNPVQRGGYAWVVFTSMRDWGNKLTGDPVNGKRRLWVAAIDGTPASADPSHAAFFLEGQEDTPNMRGFWTLAACTATPKPGDSGGTCQAGFECCSGFCNAGRCIDVSTLACSGLGGACNSADDCCNGGSGAVQCKERVCTLPTVLR